MATSADKLTQSDDDDSTWSARTWKVFAVRKISIAAHRSMAQAINLRVARTNGWPWSAHGCAAGESTARSRVRKV